MWFKPRHAGYTSKQNNMLAISILKQSTRSGYRCFMKAHQFEPGKTPKIFIMLKNKKKAYIPYFLNFAQTRPLFLKKAIFPPMAQNIHSFFTYN